MSSATASNSSTAANKGKAKSAATASAEALVGSEPSAKSGKRSAKRQLDLGRDPALNLPRVFDKGYTKDVFAQQGHTRITKSSLAALVYITNGAGILVGHTAARYAAGEGKKKISEAHVKLACDDIFGPNVVTFTEDGEDVLDAERRAAAEHIGAEEAAKLYPHVHALVRPTPSSAKENAEDDDDHNHVVEKKVERSRKRAKTAESSAEPEVAEPQADSAEPQADEPAARRAPRRKGAAEAGAKAPRRGGRRAKTEPQPVAQVPGEDEDGAAEPADDSQSYDDAAAYA